MDRIIIFTDFSTLLVPTLLTEATLKAVAERRDIQIAGICVRNFKKYHHLLYRHVKEVLKPKIKSIFDDAQCQKLQWPLPINIEKLAYQYRFKVLAPPEGNINESGFIRQLKAELKPTIALSFYCLQQFSPDLLKTFEYAVNYHNGLLPTYRGLMATCWSLYRQDSATGYTFHRLNEKLDEGNILIEGLVPVKIDSRVPDLEYAKAVQAATDIPGLLGIITNREAGRAQAGQGNYFSRIDSRSIMTIDDPSQYSHDELSNRLGVFGSLLMNIKGSWYDVTKLKSLPASHKPSGIHDFQTNDGAVMRPTRFWFLPFFMYKILKKAGWTLPSGIISPAA